MNLSLKRTLDALWGRGEYSVTVPPMDGALRPNSALDAADAILHGADIDNLAVGDGQLFYTQGRSLFCLDKGNEVPRLVHEYRDPISALAIAGDGRIAVALDSGALLVGSSSTAAMDEVGLDGRPVFVTALAFHADGGLGICVGSRHHRPSQWKRDLMLRGETGSVWMLGAGQGTASLLRDGLAYPSGGAFAKDGSVVISEAWKHRLVQLSRDGAYRTILEDLPGYPGRLSPSKGGGMWLCVFAPRSQMIEFVLKEKAYRQRMVETIDEQFWMAPDLRAGKSFREPLQGGAVKHLGIHKPWGPTRSYGLLIRLNDGMLPAGSYHSRSDGKRHGITSVVEWNDTVAVASKGDGVLVGLNETEEASPQ